jgi:hypothetical protein
MNGASIGQDYLCRAAGATRFGMPIDREVGRVEQGRRLFAYTRYNVDLGDLPELRAALVQNRVAAADLAALAAIARIDPRRLARLNATRHLGELDSSRTPRRAPRRRRGTLRELRPDLADRAKAGRLRRQV